MKNLIAVLAVIFLSSCTQVPPPSSSIIAFNRYSKCFPSASFRTKIKNHFKAAKLELQNCQAMFPPENRPDCKLLPYEKLHMSLEHRLTFHVTATTSSSSPVKEVFFTPNDSINPSGPSTPSDGILTIPYNSITSQQERPISESEILYKIFSPTLCPLARELHQQFFLPKQSSTQSYYSASYGSFGVGQYKVPPFLGQEAFGDRAHVSFMRCNCSKATGRDCVSQPESEPCKTCNARAFHCREEAGKAFTPAPSELNFSCNLVCSTLNDSKGLLVCASTDQNFQNRCNLVLKKEI